MAVTALRDLGHDVLWVRTDFPGSSDDTILARAQAEERIVITFDKDFGELAFRMGLPASCGVVLFRIKSPTAELQVRRVLAVLSQRNDWAGSFAVVTNDRIRIRPLV